MSCKCLSNVSQIVVTSKLFQAVMCSAIIPISISIHPSLDATNSGGCVPIRLHHLVKKELRYKVIWVLSMLGQVFQSAIYNWKKIQKGWKKGWLKQLTWKATSRRRGASQNGKGRMIWCRKQRRLVTLVKLPHQLNVPWAHSSTLTYHLDIIVIQKSTWKTLTHCIFGSWVLILTPLL